MEQSKERLIAARVSVRTCLKSQPLRHYCLRSCQNQGMMLLGPVSEMKQMRCALRGCMKHGVIDKQSTNIAKGGLKHV